MSAVPDRTLARQAEMAFSRAVRALPDDALEAPSLLPGWSRATLISHVTSNAAAFSRALNGAVNGGDTAMYKDRSERDGQIKAGAELPAAQLRARSDQAAALLDSVWAGLSPEQWDLNFTSGQGAQVPLRKSVDARAREVWVHLVDLGSDAAFDDVPPEVTEAVLREVWKMWAARGAQDGLAISTLDAAGAPLVLGTPESEGTTTVSGSLGSATGWATGRTLSGVTAQRRGEAAGIPAAPDWI